MSETNRHPFLGAEVSTDGTPTLDFRLVKHALNGSESEGDSNLIDNGNERLIAEGRARFCVAELDALAKREHIFDELVNVAIRE